MANKTQTHPLLKKLLSYMSSSMVGEKYTGTSIYIINTLGERESEYTIGRWSF